MKEFKRENKYLVLKWEDIQNYLLADERRALNKAIMLVNAGRFGKGKKSNTYVVVNEDESYAEQVWQLIQKHWEAKE